MNGQMVIKLVIHLLSFSNLCRFIKKKPNLPEVHPSAARPSYRKTRGFPSHPHEWFGFVGSGQNEKAYPSPFQGKEQALEISFRSTLALGRLRSAARST
jgi:hypothetical protein